MTKHILLIDDEADVRNLLAEFLTVNGFRATAVESPLEAERVVRRDPPDLIVSDLQLADSDGLLMIDKLKLMLPNTPVILLTGVLFDPSVVKELLATKVSSYLEKTSSLSQILDEVKRLTGG